MSQKEEWYSQVVSLPEELRRLCELASKEMNPEKLLALVKEIDRLFQEYEENKAKSTRFNA